MVGPITAAVALAIWMSVIAPHGVLRKTTTTQEARTQLLTSNCRTGATGVGQTIQSTLQGGGFNIGQSTAGTVQADGRTEFAERKLGKIVETAGPSEGLADFESGLKQIIVKRAERKEQQIGRCACGQLQYSAGRLRSEKTLHARWRYAHVIERAGKKWKPSCMHVKRESVIFATVQR